MADIKLEDVEALIEIFDASDWQEISVELEDCSLFLSRDSGATGLTMHPTNFADSPGSDAQDSPQVESAPQSLPTNSNKDTTMPPEGLTVVRAPNFGTFYRSPAPGKPPYIETGETVDEDTEIGLIEVMKLYTPVVAGVKGVVRDVCVSDGDVVEYDQPLFYIEPSSA